MPLYTQYVQDVMVELHTDRVIRAAMQNPQWKQHATIPESCRRPNRSSNSQRTSQIRQMPNASEMIQVIYTDSQPDAKDVAQVAVSSVISAYREIWDSNDNKEH